MRLMQHICLMQRFCSKFTLVLLATFFCALHSGPYGAGKCTKYSI